MNEALRAAAEDLLDALVWLADDALVMRRIPVHNPAASPDQGPEPEAAALQAFYPPHRRLPEPGQSLYRDLQGMIDLRFCDPRTGPHTPAEEIVRFHKSIDQLLNWLVTCYDLGQAPPEAGQPPHPGGRGPRPDPEADKKQLLNLIVQRHAGDGPDARTPFTQEELAKALGWPQSRVSRRMASIFAGGMKTYTNSCRVEKFRGRFKRGSDGRPDLEAFDGSYGGDDDE